MNIVEDFVVSTYLEHKKCCWQKCTKGVIDDVNDHSGLWGINWLTDKFYSQQQPSDFRKNEKTSYYKQIL